MSSGVGGSGGTKRPAEKGNRGGGDAKRRRADFSVGDRGIFFTTLMPGGVPHAYRDLARLLDAALPESTVGTLESTATAVPVGQGTVSATTKLDAELRQLQSAKPTFTAINHDIAKGTGFLKLLDEQCTCPPSEIAVRLLETQKKEYQAAHIAPSSRTLCRILPIDYTCRPFVDDFQKLAQTVLPPLLGPDAPPTVWALEFKMRNTNTMKKDAVLAIIDEIVPKGRHKVNITDPEKCILVEVNPLFCGLSVLSRWAEFKKYNVNALTSPEGSTNQASLPHAAVAPNMQKTVADPGTTFVSTTACVTNETTMGNEAAGPISLAANTGDTKVEESMGQDAVSCNTKEEKSVSQEALSGDTKVEESATVT